MARLVTPLLALLVCAGALAPAELTAQFLPQGSRSRRPAAEGEGIETAIIGRGGFDMQFQSLVLGALVRATFPLPVKTTVQASGDLTFFDGLTDRGAGIDGLFEVTPGLSVGGGPYWRDTVFPTGSPADPQPGADARETRLGWSAVLQLGGIGGFGGTVSGLEFRWVDVDGYNPRMITLQFGIRLTGGRGR